jgi:sugar phosphate isomerase/epimerase
MKVFHVNDFPALPSEQLTDSDRVYPGDGVAPLRPLLRDLRDIGFYRVPVPRTVQPCYYQQEPLSVARTGLEKLREVVQSAFDL